MRDGLGLERNKQTGDNIEEDKVLPFKVQFCNGKCRHRGKNCSDTHDQKGDLRAVPKKLKKIKAFKYVFVITPSPFGWKKGRGRSKESFGSLREVANAQKKGIKNRIPKLIKMIFNMN